MTVASGVLTIERQLDASEEPTIYLFSLLNSVAGSAVAEDGALVTVSGLPLVTASGAQLIKAQAAFSCAITFPLASGQALQGTPVTITGTVSKTSTVQVYLGATLLGAATMSGLTWSYTWTPLAGDVGAQTINATATDAGSATSVAPGIAITVLATIDKALFAHGLYVVSVPGNQGDAVGALASSSGATLSLTASAIAPTVFLNAAFGNKGVKFVNDGNIGYDYLTCHAMAPYLRSATGNWTIPFEGRIDKSGEQPIWSGQCSNDTNERMSLRFAGGSWIFRRQNPSGTQTLTGPVVKYPTDDVRVTVKCTAGVITIHDRAYDETVDRVTTLGTITGADFSSAFDHFAFAASFASVPFEGCTCYGAKWAFPINGSGTPLALSNADISTLHSEWQFDSLLVAGPNRLGLIRPGDSIEMEVQDIYTGAGMRNIEAEFYGTNGLSVAVRGGTEAGGAGYLGITRYAATSANSGQTIDQITTQALVDIAASVAKVGYWPCYMGGGDNNALVAPATIAANFVAKFTAVFNSLTAPLARRFTRISRLIPNQNSSIQANLVTLAGIWNAQVVAPLQAAFPGAIYVSDRYLAVGGVWSSQYFGADSGHMNRAGCIQCTLDPVYGDLAAKNELNETLAQRLLRESPTLNRVPLTGAITSPAPASSFTHGTTQTVLCDVSRIGGKPTLVVDGSDVGTLYPIEIYDYASFSGSYVKKPHVQWGYALTIPAAGSHTMAVRYLDADGVTTYTTPSVAFTSI